MGQHAFSTGIVGFGIRAAVREDVPLILRMIRELAAYEDLEHQVTATEALLVESLFERQQAQVLLAEEAGAAVGFALFFFNYSTFLGKANLYLEDLYLRPQARGKGYGKAMFACLAHIAQENGCARMDWWCLDWNKPSIAFYERMGAKAMADWTVYRVEGEALARLAEQ